jgi:Rps23 Pro-64 3,4-dihydroxylase Tpa1-like proline 4-hydroxylase
MLCTPPVLADLAETVGCEIRPDPDLYGGGIHVTDPGGYLTSHLDYALHPTGLERRINLVLFLNETWQPGWGGAFALYDRSGKKQVKEILPEPGLTIVWEAGDLSFHGTRQVSHNADPRVTAACYYLAPPRLGCCRPCALFTPFRGEVP